MLICKKVKQIIFEEKPAFATIPISQSTNATKLFLVCTKWRKVMSELGQNPIRFQKYELYQALSMQLL